MGAVWVQGGASKHLQGPDGGVVLPAAGKQQARAIHAGHERDSARGGDRVQSQVLRHGGRQVNQPCPLPLYLPPGSEAEESLSANSATL